MQLKNFKETIENSSNIFIIGVAGDSGSGKSTFSNAIASIFGEELVSTFSTDDYHIYDRETRKKMGITPLDPSANDLNRLTQDITSLKKGQSIQKPVYCHMSGTCKMPISFNPTKFIIIEGLNPYSTKLLKDLLDFTIFVDPDPEVKYEWKIRRDVNTRNYSPEQVIQELKSREDDYCRYVLTQRSVADVVIRISYSLYGKALGYARNIYRVTLLMKPPEQCLEDIELNIDLCSLFAKSSHDFDIECTSFKLDNWTRRALTVDGELMHETIHKIEKNIEAQTGIHPIDIFTENEVISASDLIRLIISWQIINTRILIEKSNSAL